MKLNAIILAAAILALCQNPVKAQKKDTYFTPSAHMMTHTDAKVAIYGDIINDAQGGIDHNNGGTLYIYRTPMQSNTASRIYDGPLAPLASDNYNTDGAYIRVFNLITDNTTNVAIPSGTQINTASGAGDIQVEQEIKVSNEHTFANGIIWTPRDQWKHAFVHYEMYAYYTGVSSNNLAGPHIDGYATRSGTGSFLFPIGDGNITRKAGVSNPENGIYKAAYFRQNAQNGTSGISGTSASSSPLASSIDAVSTQEFWDIDGTAATQITLSALNTSVNNYSNWAQDFSQAANDPNMEIGIAGWDEWEYLGTNRPTNNLNDGGYFTSTMAIIPDSPGTGTSPFSAFTWATYIKSHLSMQDLSFIVMEDDCHAVLKWNTLQENGTQKARILRGKDGGTMEPIAEVPLAGNSDGWTEYQYQDTDVLPHHSYQYRLEIISIDGKSKHTDPIGLQIKCDPKAEFVLYPNPTTGKAKIDINQNIYLSRLVIHDAVGKLVAQIEMDPDTQQNSVEMDLSTQRAGIYFLTLFSDTHEILYQNSIHLLDH